MIRRNMWFVVILGSVVATQVANADHQQLKAAQKGNPQIQSVQAIAFGPEGLLLVGDGRGKQVVAIATGDTKVNAWTKKRIPNVAGEIAGRLGTMVENIKLEKMAVNPASQTAYIAVTKKSGKEPMIVTVNGKGQINALDLTNVTYASVSLPADANVKLITDVAWADDRVLVAVQATDRFASKLFSIPTPFDSKITPVVASTNTFHVAHDRWETRAPIRTLIPYEEKGKKYVVGAFTCTPVVRYPLGGLKAGANVKGTSVIELGNGNKPRDMFVYEKNGKKYILMNTYRFFHKRRPVGPSPYWTVRVDYDLLGEEKKVNDQAIRRVDRNLNKLTDKAEVIEAYHGVAHMDQLNAKQALVVRKTKDSFDVEVLPLP
ncbi:MAG: hypothetical protein ACFCD0_05180 [Gemmataceae bacterium]